MDTSTCAYGNQNVSQSSAQRKFYQWVLKWISGMHPHTDSNNEGMRDIPTKPDVSTLASFLQAIGFKLLSFEKHNDLLIPRKNENNLESSKQVLRIAIECDTSNMRAVLELEGISCQCPNSDHVKDASFWSISGTGPTGSTDNIIQKVEETGSNLLPRLSKDVTRVLRDVSYKLFDTIVFEPDVNRNVDVNSNVSRISNPSSEFKTLQDSANKETGVIRSYTLPEIHRSSSECAPENQSKNINSDSFVSRTVSPVQSDKPVLQRQKTWDIDTEIGSLDEEPRPSPPKITSSPSIIVELSKSLGQISLQSETESSGNIAEYIIGAQQNLERALKMLLFKKPKVSINISPNQDNDCASVKSAPANISPADIISPCKPTLSNTVASAKPLSKSNHLAVEKCQLRKTISGNITKTPKVRRNIEPMLSKSATRRNIKLEQENSKPTVRRSSFYLPASVNSNKLLKSSDTGKKLVTSGKYNSNLNLTIDFDLPKRDLIATKKLVSPEQQINVSQKLETFNTSNNRISMIKPPTKISKAIPVNIKPVQPSKINTGIVKKPRLSFSKE